MIYSELDKDSKCINCLGCSQLENLWFKGKKECDNFQEGYKEEEIKDNNENKLLESE